MTDDNPIAKAGKLSYVQIPASDTQRSADFYAAVFGWTIQPGGRANHRSFEDASGQLIGAFVTDRAPSRDHDGVMPWIYVTSVAGAMKSIESHGGEIARAPYPEEDLTLAMFRDPGGNVIGVWQMGSR